MNIPLFKILWDDDDIQSISNVIKRGNYWTDGPSIKEFELKISDYIGTKYCALFNSGTSALHASLLSYGITTGDEVIVPSFTFISTVNSVMFVGATPVFADIERETLGLDPESVNEKITHKTKAIIPVHYGGCPCHIRELREIADDNDLILIEDAAESFGARVGSQHVGTFGDSAMFSFCQNKIISTGEGGAITTNSEEIFDKLKLIRSHGREDCENYFETSECYDYIQLGYNFRMSDITAALGLSQLKRVDKVIEMRRYNAHFLSEGMSHIPHIKVLQSPVDYFNVSQFFTIEVNDGYRDELINQLEKYKISSKVYFYPVHLTKFYKDIYKCIPGMLPVTEEISNKVLTLPMYPDLGKDEMDYIINSVKNIMMDLG